LLSLARKIAALKGITLDRDAKRVKDSLICWFCEHCKEDIMNAAPQPVGPVRQNPVGAPSNTADPIPEELWAAWEKDFPVFD
jgi:hypothetical protein